MSRTMLSASLAAALAGVLSMAIAAPPAYGTPEPAGDASGAGVTDPQHLVNDPLVDQTASDSAQNTPSLAAIGSTVVASYNDGWYPYSVGYSVSTDFGETWSDQGSLESDRWVVNGPAAVAADPGRDRGYLAASGALVTQPRNTEIAVFPIDAAGALGSPVAATESTDSALYPWITADAFPGQRSGTVYLAYNVGFDGLRLVRSTDGGATWSASSELPATRGQPRRARVLVSPDHCVHVVYWDEHLPQSSINSVTSCDGGATFGPVVVAAALLEKNFTGADGDLFLSGAFETNSTPQIAVNPVTGALYVVYNDLVTRDGDADVYLTTSTDSGSTWSAPVRVNADSGDHDQFSPAVAVTDDGTRLLITYYDRRSDPINLDIQRWGRVGAIDVATDTVRLANEFRLGPSFPPVQDAAIDQNHFFSDHEAVIAIGNSFVTAWTDNRDPDQVSYYQSDIRAATVPTGAPTDISVTVAAPEDVVQLGASYSYTATVRNDSNQPAGNVEVQTLLPLTAKYLSATVAGSGVCNRLGRDVTCSVGSLEPGESVDVAVTAQALKQGMLRRKAVVTTSSIERPHGNNAAAAEGQVSTAPQRTDLFSTGNIVVPVDGSAVVPLDINPGVGTALDLEVGVRMNHPNAELVSMTLISPTGVEVPLYLEDGLSLARNFGTGDNSCAGTPVVFDDAAQTTIFGARAPFTQVPAYKPHGTLSDTLGGPYAGRWRLYIEQRETPPMGYVGCVQLRIRHTT